MTEGNLVACGEFSGDHAFTICNAECGLILAAEGQERCSQRAKYPNSKCLSTTRNEYG